MLSHYEKHKLLLFLLKGRTLPIQSIKYLDLYLFSENMADWPAYGIHDVGDPSLWVVGVRTGACFDRKILMYGRVEFCQIFFTGNWEGQILKCFHCCRDLWHIQNFGLRLRKVLVIMGLNSTAVQKNALHSKYTNQFVTNLGKKTRHPWMEMLCALCVAV